MTVASFWPKMLGEAVTAALKYSSDHCNFWPERLGKAVTEALKYALTHLAKEARKAVSDIHNYIILRPHWNFWLEAGRR